MCGISGYLTNSFNNNNAMKSIAQDMSNELNHRGPDDKGMWLDELNGVAIAHNRLSIIDLSKAGHQPMLSVSNKFVISFNGEIYNHLILRKELELISKINWRGKSDTETLLVCFEYWGIKKTLNKILGMFAISLWDTFEKKLYLIRDRFGEKPLYYGFIDGSIVYASELKAIKKYPGFKNNLNKEALDKFLRLSYIPSPLSIFENIFKLEAGTIISVSYSDNNYNKNNTKVENWWSFEDTIIQNKNKLILDQDEAEKGLLETLRNSIKLQSQADVPIGAFLSGGVDSSLVCAIMQEQTAKKLQTFTIGFENKQYDESGHAKKVSSYLHTDHNEYIISSKDFNNLIPKLSSVYDEPFADSSQIPTCLVSQLTRKKVTVSLSGDGADELFGGYDRYSSWYKKINFILSIPYPLRKILGDSLKLTTNYLPSNEIIKKLKRISLVLSEKNIEDNYFNKPLSQWNSKLELIKDYKNSSFENYYIKELDNIEEQLMYTDTKTYLTDDILCKVDRATMASSLESRSPFLDFRVAKFAWKIPLKMKIKKNTTKYILKKILEKYLPKTMIYREKKGFSIPLAEWLRGPLKDWSNDLLNPINLEKQGLINLNLYKTEWSDFLNNKNDSTSQIWSLLMLQSWIENNK